MNLLLMKIMHLKYEILQGVMTPWKVLTRWKVMTPWILFAIILSSCTNGPTPPDRPNIVWITSEDNSKHYLDLFDVNGVATPNIKKLADQGIVYKHAFSNAPVCSVARSTLITGCYAPRIGAQYHRKIQIVPMPDSLKMFPAYLREAGYYTTNNSKEDYNLIKQNGVWDESSKNASWRNRKPGQPFFHVFNIGISHESSLHFSPEEMQRNKTETDLNSFDIQPNHPQTDLFRYTNAYYRDKIKEMDNIVGEVFSELEAEGILENTIIFYYGDHGGVLPGSKGYLSETGLHVPLVVYVPQKYRSELNAQPGSEQNGFVSFIDFAPTVLHLAGVDIPAEMDGQPFLGKNIDPAIVAKRNVTFSYADRFDEKYDQVRAVRKGNYKYIRYFQPFNFDGLMNNYRYKQWAYQEWLALYHAKDLNDIQAAFFQPHQCEVLYDVESDPFETNNLAGNDNHDQTLIGMRSLLEEWLTGMPDLSFYPEHYLINNAFKDPVDFGLKHKKEIANYLEIANLCLSEFNTVRDQIRTHLQSKDAWSRYWTITVCSSFGEEAGLLAPQIRNISESDPELINRVRAAEFLAISLSENPVNVIKESLYQSVEPAEALMILNTIVLMSSHLYNYSFNLDPAKLMIEVQENDEVKRRLDYLNPT